MSTIIKRSLALEYASNSKFELLNRMTVEASLPMNLYDRAVSQFCSWHHFNTFVNWSCLLTNFLCSRTTFLSEGRQYLFLICSRISTYSSLLLLAKIQIGFLLLTKSCENSQKNDMGNICILIQNYFVYCRKAWSQ